MLPPKKPFSKLPEKGYIWPTKFVLMERRKFDYAGARTEKRRPHKQLCVGYVVVIGLIALPISVPLL